jgi:phosphoribosylformylglycinamidine synthase subunit PurL
MIMHLDKVPACEENMTPYDFMFSESQECMLLCAKKGSEQAIIDIFEKWDLDAAVVGEVTDTGNMELFWHGEKCAEVPVDPVSEEAPELNRPMTKPAYLDEIASVTINDFDKVSNQDAFETLTKSMEVVDKSWIYTQYDSMVQTNTIKNGGMLDASVIRVKENGKALAMSADCNVRFCYIDPRGGGAAATMEAGRNVAMSGARPLAITDCLNFGNPENPEVMWQFGQACDGIKEACLELTTPVIGGNVSLYNETNGVSVFPTPSIATVGVNDDQNNVLMSSFQGEGNALYLVGESKSEFGGSLYMKEICGTVAGVIPEINYKNELALWELVIEDNKKHLLECAKDASSGGVAIALAKMCATSGMGCDVEMSVEDERDIFAESMSRAIIEVKPENQEAFEATLEESMACEKIGTVGGNSIRVNDVTMSMDELQDNYFNTFKKVIERDL